MNKKKDNRAMTVTVVFMLAWFVGTIVITVVQMIKKGSDVTDVIIMQTLWSSVCSGFGVGMVASIVTMAAMTSSMKSKKKKEREKLKASGILNIVHSRHMSGLPIAEGAECDIYEYIDRFIFRSSGTEITLEKRKITDVSLKTDKEISANYVSSIGGAVAGAALFGPLGAMVGGRAKQKNSTIVYQYLILTYLKGESVDYVSFDVTESLNDATEIYNGYINRPGRTEPRVAVKL